MANLKDIKKRIINISVIEKVTNSMKAISTARLANIKLLLANTSLYYSSSHEVFTSLLAAYGNAKINNANLYNFLYNKSALENGKTLFIIIASDKGLCGGYNSNIFKELNKKTKDLQGNYFLLPIGLKAASFASKFSDKLIFKNKFHSDIKKITYDDIRLISYGIVKRITNQEINDVYIISTKNISVLQQEVLCDNLMVDLTPKNNVDNKYVATDDEYLGESLDGFVENYISYLLYKKITMSFLAEYSARLNAMDGANENSKELQKNLKLQYNRTRQGLITKELIEIISGSESL